MNENDQAERTVTVRGTITFPPGERPHPPFAVIIQVEDVSRADAPSTIVGESRLENPALAPASSAGSSPAETPDLKFSVAVPEHVLTGTARVNVRVHVQTGVRQGLTIGEPLTHQDVTEGDFVTTRSYPVDPGLGSVRVLVHRV